MKSEEDYFRFDTEKLIYDPLYEIMDLNPLVNNYEYNMSKGQSGKNVSFNIEYFTEYLKNMKLKNGFIMTVLEFGTINRQMRNMMQMSEELIVLIDKEVGK